MISHHLAHAYSAYHASGFADALVIVVDGVGNSLDAIRGYRGEDAEHVRRVALYADINGEAGEKISIYSVRDHRFEVVRKDFSRGSIGFAYRAATAAIFGQMREAGKTMGLAPYGRPGRFELDLVHSHDGVISYPYLGVFTGLELPRIPKQWPEDHTTWSEDLMCFADLAWKAQADVERAMVELATHAQRATGHRRLCLAGGVALNSVANKLIADRAGFDDVYIIPAAGDDGISIGCAYWGTFHALSRKPRAGARPLSAAVGRAYTPSDIGAAAAADLRLTATQLDDDALLARTVAALAAGKIVAWFQGRSEIGPRALGQRSILASALHPDMKSILNRRVKFREAFRPFAPVVPLERADEYFELGRASPYMLLVAPVIANKRALLASITHVDGTARVQTVTAQDNGRFYRLVCAFGDATGTPVLLNTSFNIKGEPIVETPAQAVECFLCTDIDVLVLEDQWIEKRELDDAELLAARPAVNPRVFVDLRHQIVDESWTVTSATTGFIHNAEHAMQLDPALAGLLLEFDGLRTVDEIASDAVDAGDTDDARETLLSAVRGALGRNLLRLPP
jgi:carbamoyltransferase